MNVLTKALRFDLFKHHLIPHVLEESKCSFHYLFKYPRHPKLQLPIGKQLFICYRFRVTYIVFLSKLLIAILEIMEFSYSIMESTFLISDQSRRLVHFSVYQFSADYPVPPGLEYFQIIRPNTFRAPSS